MYCKELISKLNASQGFVSKLRIQWESYGGPKGSNTNQFPKTQINFPKHKLIVQNRNQFSKTQINFPKHKSISRNTNQFHESLISFRAKRLGTTLI